jgi:hypothetical protein
MDRNQREEMPSPSFQGVRVIDVQDDVVTGIHYVTLTDLRRNDYLMPWEQQKALATGGAQG